MKCLVSEGNRLDVEIFKGIGAFLHNMVDCFIDKPVRTHELTEEKATRTEERMLLHLE